MLRSRTPRHSDYSGWGEDYVVSGNHLLKVSPWPQELNRPYLFPRNKGRYCTHRKRLITSILFVLCLGVWLLLSIVLRVGSPSVPSRGTRGKDGLPGVNGSSVSGSAASSLAPMVDRAILQKLHGLQTEDPDEHRNPNKPLNSDEKPRWPPIVTALPEARIASSSSTHLAGVSTEALDAQFCESAPCRLLLPLSFPEREPKAQVHLAHVLSLARSLNRTLILPNVGHGRVGACQKWEFDAYFDIASIVRTSGASVMMMDDFKTWVDMRPKKPDAQIIVVDEIATEEVLKDGTSFFGDGVNVDVGDMQDGALKGVRCLKSRFRHMRLDGFSPLSAHLISSDQHSFWSANSSLLARALTREDVRLAAVRHNQATGDDLALDAQFGLQQEPLQSPSSASDPEVFLLQWDSHQVASSATTIEYSSKLWTLADKLVASLGNFLSVHWYMERVPPAVLPACAEALVDTLDALLLEGGLAEGLRTVWIASDYPQPFSGLPAETSLRKTPLKEIWPEHEEAVGIVRAAFGQSGELAEWKLTGFTEELAKMRASVYLDAVEDERLLLQDPGFVDILERMVAMKANLFVTSAKGCGRVGASTKQVVEFRSNVETGDIPRNVVSLFG